MGRKALTERFAVRFPAEAAHVSRSGLTPPLFWLLVVRVIAVCDHVPSSDIIFTSAACSQLPQAFSALPYLPAFLAFSVLRKAELQETVARAVLARSSCEALV